MTVVVRKYDIQDSSSCDLLQFTPIYIRGEDRPVRELPTRDGGPECDAVCSGAGPSEMMALVSLVPNSNEDVPD